LFSKVFNSKSIHVSQSFFCFKKTVSIQFFKSLLSSLAFLHSKIHNSWFGVVTIEYVK
jgi:hypothetical protein